MTNDSSIRFTLTDNTRVVVKEVANDKYDFELILPTGNHKTFLWTIGNTDSFRDKKGNNDLLITEAIRKFVTLM